MSRHHVTDMLNAESPSARRERRRLYLDMIYAIAHNDGPGDADALKPASLAHQVTVVLAADVFGKDPIQVARAVARIRKQENT